MSPCPHPTLLRHKDSPVSSIHKDSSLKPISQPSLPHFISLTLSPPIKASTFTLLLKLKPFLLFSLSIPHLFLEFQIWIYGNSFESCLIAIVNPNQQKIEQWASNNGVSGEFASLCSNPKVKEYLLGVLSKIGKDKKLKGFEFVKAVHLDPIPFDMERDLLTPTFKKKRPQLLKYYEKEIGEMYKNGPK